MGTPAPQARPVALVVHDRLMPGSALANRLVDRGWQVQSRSGIDGLLEWMRSSTPMMLVIQLDLRGGEVCRLIQDMRADAGLSHIAVLAYGPLSNGRLREDALSAGAQVVAADSLVLDQLPSLLEAALAVD